MITGGFVVASFSTINSGRQVEAVEASFYPTRFLHMTSASNPANRDLHVRRKAQETLDELVSKMGLEDYGMDAGNAIETNVFLKSGPASGAYDEEEEDDAYDSEKEQERLEKEREKEERAQEERRKKMYSHFQKRGIAESVSPEGIVDFASIIDEAERPVVPGISRPEDVAAAVARSGAQVDIRSLQNQIMELQYAENVKRTEYHESQKRKHRMLIFFEMFLDPEVETHGEAWLAFKARHQQQQQQPARQS